MIRMFKVDLCWCDFIGGLVFYFIGLLEWQCYIRMCGQDDFVEFVLDVFQCFGCFGFEMQYYYWCGVGGMGQVEVVGVFYVQVVDGDDVLGIFEFGIVLQFVDECEVFVFLQFQLQFWGVD